MTQLTDAETAEPIRGSVRPRRIGSSDLTVFPLAISGNVFGWTADDATTNDILDAYAARGGNFIDTADSYAAGRSELMIGNWMRKRRNRNDMVVATKVGKSADNPGLRARMHGCPPAPRYRPSICCTCTSTTHRLSSRRHFWQWMS